MAVAVNPHKWVKLSYVPVVVEPTDEGNLSVFIDLVAEVVAEEEALISCWFCHETLTTLVYGQHCSGTPRK